MSQRIPFVEVMEDRLLLATYTVTNTNNSGSGSLRDAITKANAGSSADVIAFKIGSGLKTISPTSGLPHLKYPVTIDGSTQPGYSGKPIIEIRGDRAGSGSYGLVVGGGNSTVKGLIVNRFGQTGILVKYKGGNTIKGCWVGVNNTGTSAAGNKNKGIIVQTSNNTIGGTSSSDRVVSSGNTGPGVQFYTSGAKYNKMMGTYVGTNASGTAAIPNTSTGVTFRNASYNTIGGTSSGARNVISGNASNGITVNGSGAKYNKFIGNYVGLNASGTARLGNTNYGIEISEPNNTVGGTTSGSRNVISANGKAGVVLWLASGSYNTVKGNYIGTDYTGMKDLGNRWGGVHISEGSSNNTVGGSTSADRNVISGNDDNGVMVWQGRSNRINGNYIGYGSNGSADVGNTGNGIRLIKTSSNSTSGNKIGFNSESAIANV